MTSFTYLYQGDRQSDFREAHLFGFHKGCESFQGRLAQRFLDGLHLLQ